MALRTVHHTDALSWLEQAELPADHALVTSLPDVSETKLSLEAWQAFFARAASAVLRATAPQSVAIFYQSDIKHEGRWVDKAFLVQLAAKERGAHLLWHKIVCRAPAGVTTYGRPAYAHLLCFSRALRLDPRHSTPDVLPQLGAMTWKRAMGIAACQAVCEFLRASTPCTTVVDPFCGVGTMLAVANAYGFDAIGVELAEKRAKQARELNWLRSPTVAG